MARIEQPPSSSAIQGIAGGSSLPELKQLQLEPPAAEEEAAVPATN
jgi:hypothetical protein